MSPCVIKRIPEDPPITDVTVTGNVVNSGLSIGYRYTSVTIPSGVWTKLPTAALPQRNTLCIQNESATDIRINSDKTDPLPVGLVGTLCPANGERFYNVTDGVGLWARQDSGGAVVIGIEEVA